MSLGTSPNPLISSTTIGLDTNRRKCIVADEETGPDLQGRRICRRRRRDGSRYGDSGHGRRENPRPRASTNSLWERNNLMKITVACVGKIKEKYLRDGNSGVRQAPWPLLPAGMVRNGGRGKLLTALRQQRKKRSGIRRGFGSSGASRILLM